MKILANENIPFTSVKVLRNEGYDVKAVGDEFQGITDKEVIELAIIEKRLIITFDKDYGELIFKYQLRPPEGVIYLRFSNFTANYPAEFLLNLFKNTELTFDFTFTVIDENSVRQRRY
jgi:predicted nuclease of predicted toxin-antitoxin system